MGATRIISIIIPALNAEKTIQKCISSIFLQKYNDFEVIIVDNGSEDDTMEIIKRFKKVRLLKEKKKNSYAARNKGIRNAKGDILVFTDADCIVENSWLKNMISPFKNEEIMAVGGRIRSFSNKSKLQNYLDIFGHPQELYYDSNIPSFATSSMAVRADAIKRYGLFTEDLPSGADFEFCSRIKDKKHFHYSDDAIIKHVYPDTTLKLVKKSYYYGRWAKKRRDKFNIEQKIVFPSYYSLFKKYGFSFLYYRLLHDISFNIGMIK